MVQKTKDHTAMNSPPASWYPNSRPPLPIYKKQEGVDVTKYHCIKIKQLDNQDSKSGQLYLLHVGCSVARAVT